MHHSLWEEGIAENFNNEEFCLNLLIQRRIFKLWYLTFRV